MNHGPNFNTVNVPLTPGQKVPSFPFELGSQQIPIRGVIVDNANSTTDVYVYGGPGVIGVPYIIKAGWSRGFSIMGTSAIFVTFPNTPSAPGQVYIAVSYEPQAAFSTQVASVSITGNVPVTQAGPFTVGQSGTWNVNSVAAGPYPSTGTNYNIGSNYSFSSGSGAAIIATIPGTLGQNFYLTHVSGFGFTPQPLRWVIAWQVSGITFNPILMGVGDFALEFDTTPIQNPINIAPSELKISIPDFANIIGTWNVEINVNGYYF